MSLTKPQKLKGVNIDTIPTLIQQYSCAGIVQFEFAKVNGAKNNSA